MVKTVRINALIIPARQAMRFLHNFCLSPALLTERAASVDLKGVILRITNLFLRSHVSSGLSVIGLSDWSLFLPVDSTLLLIMLGSPD